MKTLVPPDVLTRALAREMAAVWAATAGTPVETAAGEASAAPGWIVALPLSGVASGRAVLWFDAEAAVNARQWLTAEADSSDDGMSNALATLAVQACEAMASSADGAGLLVGTASVRQGSAPADAQPFVLKSDGLTWPFAVFADIGVAPTRGAGDADALSESVLEVDLPLMVRFARATIPLRGVADLGPGSVVDMGRGPEEPVELLVGERLIARGEVVVVGGNYGVRITEVTSGRRSTDMEAQG